MDEIVAKAQASISKVLQSPFGMRNNLAGSPGSIKGLSGAYDSLDAMRQDFMNDYQRVMRESGETFFQPQHPSLSAQKDKQVEQKKSPLQQMIQAAQPISQEEVCQLQIENE